MPQIQKLWLTVKQATLQIEQSEHERQIAVFETDGYAAKVSIAEDEIQRRQIKSPIIGEVVEVQFRPGEWVEPGNTLFRIVRLDRLRVEGFLNVSDFAPLEVANRTVRVSVPLAAGGPKPSRARSCSSIRWSKPAATTWCVLKWTTARKRTSGSCGQGSRPI